MTALCVGAHHNKRVQPEPQQEAAQEQGVVLGVAWVRERGEAVKKKTTNTNNNKKKKKKKKMLVGPVRNKTGGKNYVQGEKSRQAHLQAAAAARDTERFRTTEGNERQKNERD